MRILSPGTRVGELLVKRHLGSGAVADVYEVWTEAGEQRALKLLREGLGAKAKVRLAQEAEAVAMIEHVNVVGYFGGGMFEERLWILVELVDGSDLRRLADRGAIPIERLVKIVRQACEGVAAAHRRGIVHHDLKPENILVTPNGVAKVADFGSARLGAWGVKTTAEQDAASARYLSPEFVRDRAVCAESDVFAIGVVLYELLAGVHPFCPEPLPTMAVCMRLLEYAPPLPLASLGRDVPGDLSHLVQRALAADPRDRRSMREMADGLEGVLQPLLAPRRESARALPVPDRGPGYAQTELAIPAVGPRGTVAMPASGDPPRRPTTLPPEPSALPTTKPSPAARPVARTVPMTEVQGPGDCRTTGIPVSQTAPRPLAAARDAASRSRVSGVIAAGALVVGGGVAGAAWLVIGHGDTAAPARAPAAPAVSSVAPAASSSAPRLPAPPLRRPPRTKPRP